MKHSIVVVLSLIVFSSSAQKYVCQNGIITFFSTTPVENINATNKQVISIFNEDTGDIAFSLPVKAFQFEKSLMEEHFNEKYLESDVYPKSSFQGKVESFQKGNHQKQSVIAKGKLTIHGVSQDVEMPGTLERVNGNWSLHSTFMIKLADYKVTIPQILWQNIAEQVEVSVQAMYSN